MAQEGTEGLWSVWEQRWRELVSAWRSSGQTQQEFCRVHGISASSFSGWKNKLAKRDQSRAGASSVGLVAVSAEGGLTAASGMLGWTEVCWPLADPNTAVPGGAGFEIVLPRGWSVRLGPQFEAEPLRRLLSVLEERTC